MNTAFDWQAQPRKTSSRRDNLKAAAERRAIKRLAQGAAVNRFKGALAPIDYTRQVVAHSRA